MRIIIYMIIEGWDSVFVSLSQEPLIYYLSHELSPKVPMKWISHWITHGQLRLSFCTGLFESESLPGVCQPSGATAFQVILSQFWGCQNNRFWRCQSFHNSHISSFQNNYCHKENNVLWEKYLFKNVRMANNDNY